MLEFPMNVFKNNKHCYFTYRIGLHQVTPLGVVFLFMQIGGLKNINVFYSTFTNVFF